MHRVQRNELPRILTGAASCIVARGSAKTAINMPRSRCVRVGTPPLPVRIARASGRLINVSATGALVMLNRALRTGAELSVHLTLDPAPIELQARVVRSDVVQIKLDGATWNRQEHEVALAFTNVPALARRALRQLCGEAFDAHE